MDFAAATTIVTVIIALMVAIITWRELVTNRSRLRHELFDRRYEIYHRIAGFIGGVLQSGCVEADGDIEFLRDTKKAYFVYGGDLAIKDFVNDIFRHASELHALHATENGLVAESLAANLEKQNQVKQWFQDTLDKLEPRFEKFLRLDH